MKIEKHTGLKEKYEKFNGMMFKCIAHVKTEKRADEIQELWKHKGYFTRKEHEGVGHWNVYTRRK